MASNLDDDDSRGLEEKGGVADSRGSGLEINGVTDLQRFLTNDKCLESCHLGSRSGRLVPGLLTV